MHHLIISIHISHPQIHTYTRISIYYTSANIVLRAFGYLSLQQTQIFHHYQKKKCINYKKQQQYALL